MPERAEDLVGRDVEEAEAARGARAASASPIAQRLLQQREGADDVGLDEFAGAVDRAVDMAFGGEVHHGVGLVAGRTVAQTAAPSQMSACAKA